MIPPLLISSIYPITYCVNETPYNRNIVAHAITYHIHTKTAVKRL